MDSEVPEVKVDYPSLEESFTRLDKLASVPAELMPETWKGGLDMPSYDDLQDLLDRVYDNPYGDRIEAARWPDETRAEAKRRLMHAVYDADMRKKYAVPPKEFVQGAGVGLPYSTHNPLHFVNRYGMGGPKFETIRVGIFKDTPAEMMRHEARENGARLSLRLLGH